MPFKACPACRRIVCEGDCPEGEEEPASEAEIEDFRRVVLMAARIDSSFITRLARKAVEMETGRRDAEKED